jgi:isopentenyl-diphosphate delta-isomerase
MSYVIVIDKYDNEVGLCEKLEAHQKGLLHRAFSIFLYNEKKELLLQKRSLDKYHSGGLWSNSCCSHHIKDELINNTLKKRLFEELGVFSSLKFLYTFSYYAFLDNNLIENEITYIFIGYISSEAILNLNLTEVKEEFLYTIWFKKIILETNIIDIILKQ